MNTEIKSKKSRLLAILLSVLITVTFMPQMGVFGVQEAKAAAEELTGGGTMELTGEGSDPNNLDNKVPVEAGGEATFKVNSGSTTPRYDFQVVLGQLPQGEGRKIKIELSEGLSWVREGTDDPNVQASLKEGSLVIEPKDEAIIKEYVVDGRGGVNKYQLSTDEKYWIKSSSDIEAELNPQTTGLTWAFTVQLDLRKKYISMEDAIKVTYMDADGNEDVQSIDVTAVGYEGWEGEDQSQRAVIVANHKTTDVTSMVGGSNISSGMIGNLEYRIEVPQGVIPVLREECKEFFTEPARDASGIWTSKTRYPFYPGAGGSQHKSPFALDVDVEDGTKSFEVKMKLLWTNLNGELISDTNLYKGNWKCYVGEDNEKIFAQKETINLGAASDYNIDRPHNFPERAPAESLASVGTLAIGNSGMKDSAPKTVHLRFDTSKVRVLAVPLVVLSEDSVYTVKVKSKNNSDEWKTVTLKTAKQGRKQGIELHAKEYYVTAKELGLADNDCIKEFSYEMGVLPANTASGSEYNTKILGKALVSTGVHTIGTVEIRNTDGTDVTTGEININTNFVNQFNYTNTLEIGVSDHSKEPRDPERPSANSSAVAGKESETKVISLWPGNNPGQPFSDYDAYICVPENATLNIQKILMGDTPVTQEERERYYSIDPEDITSYVRVSKKPIETTSQEGKTVRYYKLDFSNVPVEKRTVGWGYDSDGIPRRGILHIYYSVNTKVTTPGGTYKYVDDIFFEMKNAKAKQTNSLGRATAIDGNPFNLNISGGSLLAPTGNEGLTVTPHIIVRAQTESKTPGMEKYVTYDEADPQTILPVGIDGEDASVEMKTTVTNLSGINAPENTTTWIPIPKKGDNWGKLSQGCKNSAGKKSSTAPFSVKLTGALSGIDEDIFEVTYGIGVIPVPEGDYTKTWDEGNGTWKTAAQVEEAGVWDKVNCVRLRAKNPIPDFDAKGNAWSQAMKANVIVDRSAAEDAENAVLAISPVTYKDLTTPDGKRYEGIDIGEATAMSIATGLVKGTIFNDKNQNGKKDAGEEAVSGIAGDYKVSLWGGAKGQRQKMQEKDVRADGTYGFGGVSTDEVYEGYYSIRITNGEGGKKFRAVNDDSPLAADELIVSPKAEGSAAGTGQDNAFLHSSQRIAPEGEDINDLKGYAFSTPVTATDDLSSGGNYNLGVYFGKDVATKATFNMDESKGEMTDRSGDWVKITKGSKGGKAAQFVYEAAPADKLIYPSVEAKAGYKFVGWLAEGAPAGAMPAKNPGDAIFGYADTVYTPVFSSDDENVTKQELQNLVNAAKSVDKEQYAEKSVKDLDAAVDYAEDVLKDVEATNADYKAAKDLLQETIAGMKSAREGLDDAVKEALSYEKDDFTEETWKDLEDAVVMAEDQLNDPVATPDELKDATRDVETAIKNLVPTPTGLQKAVEDAKAIDQNDYTPLTAKDLADAIAFAEPIAEKGDSATEDELKAAFDALRDATAGLKKKVDAELENALDDGLDVKRDRYTEDSLKGLDDAIAKAIAVIGNPESTDGEKQSATDELNDAIKGLVPTQPGLKEIVDEAKDITANEKDGYTSETLKALDDAIKAAEKVANDKNATDAQRKKAKDDIEKAKEDLVPTTAGLQKKVDQAKAIDTSIYTKESARELNAAIAAAEEVIANPSATDDQKKKAMKDLVRAMNGLEPTPEALNNAAQYAENIIANDKDKYTEGSIKDLKDSVGGVRTLGPNATASQKRKALKDLNSAQTNLVTKEAAAREAAAKDLQKAVDEAKKINTAKVVPSVAKALTDAIKAAEKAIADPKTTAAQLKTAQNNLKKAVDNAKGAPKLTNLIKQSPVGANIMTLDAALATLKSDSDIMGSTFGKLRAKGVAKSKTAVNVSWIKTNGATKYVVYGNRCGKKNTYKKLKTFTGKKLTVKKLAGKKLKKGTYCKFFVAAIDKNGKVIAVSKTVHVATKGVKKKFNPTKVTVTKKVVKKAKALKMGKTLKLAAKAKTKKGMKFKKHVAVRYESSNTKIATVTKAGKVKGVKKGKCYVWAYAQNGIAKKINIAVK